jgi:hypothetical protein
MQHRLVNCAYTHLCSCQWKASDLLLVQLEKPAEFQFPASQFAEVVLIESPVLNLEETFRTFSFVSAPSDLNLEGFCMPSVEKIVSTFRKAMAH